jgi:hypothetical protein
LSAKITAFFITLVINVAIGVVVFFFLLLALNGYSESDATYGIVVYIALALIVSLTMSACASLTTHVLLKRKFRVLAAVAISSAAFSIVGIGLKIVCCVVGVMISEFVRVNY